MAVSNIKALIPGELQKVWELVLNTENYAAWRSDLSKTEAISDKQFTQKASAAISSLSLVP